MKEKDSSKSFTSAEEMFKEIEDDFKKENPIGYWVDNSIFKGKSLFGYAPHYSLTHPIMLSEDLYSQIKWAWQRVYRGWDDRAAWSIDYWLDGMMPDILRKLKESKDGVPCEFLTNNEKYSDEDFEKGLQKWHTVLDKMIRAFEIGKEMDELSVENYASDYEKLQLEFEEGMGLFVKYYRNLWD